MKRKRFASAGICALAAVSAIIAQNRVTLNVGDSFQQAVNANAGNTIFTVKSGTHRSQSVQLKSGNQFIGEDGAVMDGQRRMQYAFQGSVADVVIKNLEITNYNSRRQHGVINCNPINDGASHGSRDWLIENCEIHHNGGGAISVGNGFVVRNNYVHHQEQIGIVYGGQGSVVEGNEVAFCNWERKYNQGWEAGGSKWKWVKDFVLRYNYSHDNFGPGFWADFCLDNSLVEGNICINNAESGLVHEISLKAKFSCNICIDNGYNWDPWLWGAGILVSSSEDVEIAHNMIVVHADYGNGISVINQRRGRASSKNAWVHHNDIIHRGEYGKSGIATDWDFDNFYANANNMFDYNTYHVPDPSQYRWMGSAGEVGWEGFRAAGYEEHGSVDTDYDKEMTICDECVDVLAKNRFLEQAVGVRLSKRTSAAPRDPSPDAVSLYAAIDGRLSMPASAHSNAIAVFDPRGRRVAFPGGSYMPAARCPNTVQSSMRASGVYIVRVQ